MNKTIKRIITFMMAAAIVASMAVTAVNASPGNPEFMLALGDSITTGYGLDEYLDGGSPYLCDSYANMIAEALGLKGGESYINKAVNGATSTDLLALLPEIENYLGYADFIVVTVGGNDLLHAIPLVASSLSGKNITSLEGAIGVLTAATPDQFVALANNPDFQAKIGAVLGKYATNLASIGAIIKKNAPDAHVLFLKQYNPMNNVLGFADFGNFADTLIASINSSMETICTTYGFDIADAPSVINVNAAGLTNILNYDIHPNANGHVELAKLVASHLGITLDASGETAPVVTEPVTEPVIEPETSATCEGYTTAEPNVTDAPVIDTGNCEGDGPVSETEPTLEAPGCFSSISSAVIVFASVAAFAVLKKKEN